MKKQIIVIQALAIAIALSVGVSAQQQPQQKQQEPPKAPAVDRNKLPLAQRPNLTIADVNTEITIDKRVIVMMAALNIAGYDYEPANRQLSALRRQVREDLKNTRPDLVRRLRDHFTAHRKEKNDAAAVAPYLSLAVSLTEPPAFMIDMPAERLPADVREITDFALLLEEFYRETGFSKLLPKYTESYLKAAQTYPQAAGLALGTVLAYLHTEPVLELPPLYIPRRAAPPSKPVEKKSDKKDDQGKKEEPPPENPNRIRRFVIMPDLLNSAGAANLRIIRDTYYLLLGPTTEPNIEAIRRGFLSFVIDPLTERQVKEVAAIGKPLKKLMETRGDRLDPEYAQRSAYYLITYSLVRATDARMDVLGLATRRQSSEDEAIYQMSLEYDRGAVLVYHFYDQMKAFEAVGVNMRDYFSSLLQNIDFEREANRLDEHAQRLARYKQLRTEATFAPAPPPTISNADEKVVASIVEADQMLKARKYTDAKAVLEAAKKERPDNARVLFGLGEVTSKQASTLDDVDRVEETLYAAVEYYRLAAKNASPETEKWLAQRSYVAAAKILDFIAENSPAVAEKLSAEATAAFELALKLGKVEGGAYEEAERAMQQRAQKSKQ
ncbi:MAG: hypothetical protein MOB07_14125 [Acidobacteria bacterium]|nr:hypothetical protein [Acidobacteriota bacterium]